MSDLHDFYTPEEMALMKREGLDTVEGAFAYAGGRQLRKPGLGTRSRVRLELTDDAGRPVTWYMKRYGPVGRRARLLRSIFLPWRRPQTRADIDGVVSLDNARVPTMRLVHGGEEWDGLGFVRGYVIVTAVAGEALSRCLEDCLARWDEAQLAAFNAALVELAERLHSAGLAHRDLYTAHIFLDETAQGPKLQVIDLTRVFRPRWRKFRWQVKDLAQIKFSMPAGWVEGHWEGFLDEYLSRRGSGSYVLGRGRRAWSRAIDRKVAFMQGRQRRRRK